MEGLKVEAQFACVLSTSFSFHTRITTQFFSHFTGIIHAVTFLPGECHHYQNAIMSLTFQSPPCRLFTRALPSAGGDIISADFGLGEDSLGIKEEKEMLFLVYQKGIP